MPADKPPVKSTLKTDEDWDVQVVRPEPLRILLEWEAPVRVFRRRGREFFSTLGAIVFLVTVILVFLKEWFLIGAIIAMSFMVYILSTIPPENTKHKITNRGIATAGADYPWDLLSRFWFTIDSGQKTLHIETKINYPRRLIMLLGETDQENVKKIISDYLPMEEPDKGWSDKASDLLKRVVPLEKTP
jgi:hypothetical protein